MLLSVWEGSPEEMLCLEPLNQLLGAPGTWSKGCQQQLVGPPPAACVGMQLCHGCLCCPHLLLNFPASSLDKPGPHFPVLFLEAGCLPSALIAVTKVTEEL